MFTLHVGIDVAARSASVAWLTPPVRPFSVKQTPEGMADLREKLLTVQPIPAQTKIVMEATAGYWINLARFLYECGFYVSVVNPIQARRFAEAMLQYAKTDDLDAKTLAQLAEKLDTRSWTPPPPVYEELYQRLKQREALVEMRARSLNRIASLSYRPQAVPAVNTRLDSLYKVVHVQVTSIDKELAVVLRSDAQWNATWLRIRDIEGIGIVTAAWLMVSTMNFTMCQTPEQLVSYVGLAPFTRQSGTSLNSHRKVGGGSSNRRVRHLVYMATLSAIKLNPAIRAHYQHLTGQGKNGKVAVIACARKLLHIVWAVATKDVPYDPNYSRGSQRTQEKKQ